MKAYILTVTFEPHWILNNRASGGMTVIDDVLQVINAYFSSERVVVAEKEFHQCKSIILQKNPILSTDLGDAIRADVDVVDDHTHIGIKVEEIDPDYLKQELEPVYETLSRKTRTILKKEYGLVLEEFDQEEDRGVDVDRLIGLEPLKNWIQETESIANQYKELVALSGMFHNVVYLISMNRGNGLTTVLELMAQTLKETELVDFLGKCEYLEWDLRYSDHPEEFPSFEGLLRALDKCKKVGRYRGILALNIEEWIDHLADKKFDQLLEFMWDYKDEIVFVFTIPYVEEEVLQKVSRRLDDIINVRKFKFVPPSDAQYFSYFVEFFKKYEIQIEDDAFSAFVSKITREKNDGRFYGFNTVKKIATEILYQFIAKAAQGDLPLSKTVTESDLSKLYDLADDELLSGMEQLENMIALEEVKDRIREILSTAKLQKELYKSGGTELRPCFHMMFTGNPGTGKTVVARIIGRIFKEEGLLPIGNFYEVSRKDFIGRFVGHTAPKTMEICRNALGSVLFIDEAYMLADDRDGYSAEAIGTLIAEMENNRDNMVVIFAGYEKELEDLFAMNPGLRDRIPYKIHFPNYTCEELREIFYLQFKNKMEYDSSFEEQADRFFAEFPEEVLKMRDFSNARFVRNLSERIISKAALRYELSGSDIQAFRLTGSDFDVAIADQDFKKLFAKEKKVSRIGF